MKGRCLDSTIDLLNKFVAAGRSFEVDGKWMRKAVLFGQSFDLWWIPDNVEIVKTADLESIVEGASIELAHALYAHAISEDGLATIALRCFLEKSILIPYLELQRCDRILFTRKKIRPMFHKIFTSSQNVDLPFRDYLILLVEENYVGMSRQKFLLECNSLYDELSASVHPDYKKLDPESDGAEFETVLLRTLRFTNTILNLHFSGWEETISEEIRKIYAGQLFIADIKEV